MNRSEFREALLAVMDRKIHWAWPGFTSGLVPRERLHVHLEQEYAVYVRDFPVLVARAYVDCPIAEARRELIANVYEEETGGLAAGRPHPELFLEYPRGLGMDLSRFDAVELLPESRHLRDIIDHFTLRRGWEAAAVVTTLFLEGTANERRELEGVRVPPPPLEQHPLVLHYGLPVEHLALTKAHRSVEGDHRRSAWKVVLDAVPADARLTAVDALEKTHAAWLDYRDAVARACGLARGPAGEPVLSAA